MKVRWVHEWVKGVGRLLASGGEESGLKIRRNCASGLRENAWSEQEGN